MSYNKTTKSYTLEDQSSKPLDWIVEGCDPADYTSLTDDDFGKWVDTLIDNEKENDTYDLDKALDTMIFPRYGYTTAQIFENANEYRAFKLQEMNDDFAAERADVIAYLKAWVASR